MFVRHFCLNTLKGIIISKWNKLSKEEKDYIHKLVCDYMKEVIDALETSGLRGKVKVMVGGAPVSDAFAKSIGADAYTSNANAAVIMAKKLINAC